MGIYVSKKISNFHLNKKIIKNILVPAISAAAFAITVCYWNTQDYGLALEYNGRKIATVKNEDVYEKANHLILNQLDSGNKIKLENNATQIKITPIKEKCCESPTEVKDKIIEQSQEVISRGAGLYLNGTLVAVGENTEDINKMINEILEEHKSKKPEYEVEFTEKVEVTEGIFSPQEVKNKEEFKNFLLSGAVKNTEYVVQKGDTVLGIAKKLNITPERLMELNNIKDMAIYVDDTLIIEKNNSKILNLKFSKIEAQEKIIPYKIIKEEDPSQSTSWEQVMQKGVNGQEVITYKVTEFESENKTVKEEIEHKTTIEPICQKIKVGTKKIAEKTGLSWPVPYTRSISSKYGMRGRSFHQGIDISSHGIGGKDIIAAASGTIKSAQSSGMGYGNHIIISHSNNIQTLYGHCSKLLVKPDQKVQKGQVIAKVGSTGNSTGNHLHFEVRVNGKACNPSQYV